MKEIIIIGGGASGLFAAIVAARQGAKVCLLERLNRVGKKILVTGNGRCNLTNTKIEKKCYHSASSIDMMKPLLAFDEKRTLSFFEELGILPLIEGEKVYPRSEQANSVLDVLRMEMERLGVEVIVDAKVTDLKHKKDKWVVTTEEGTSYQAKKVLVATGGLTNTSLGCDGSGYELLQKLGHHMKPTFPTLVHVLSPSPYPKMMKGTKVKALASVFVNKEKIREEYGEVLFTEDGLSGPTIFQLSRVVSKAHLEGKKANITLDLYREYSKDDMVSLLYKRISDTPWKTIENLLVGMLNKRVAIAVFKCAKISAITRTCDALEYDEIERLVNCMKTFLFEVEGTRNYKFAQVTAGGIDIEEVCLETMASKKAKGLFVAGEVLDVDGDCGGFNLQWAWSTGYVAGLQMAKEIKEEEN